MTAWDPAWLDRQYNNRARVPECTAILPRWAEASALVRGRLDGELDVPYGDSPAETLDAFPADRPGSPILVFIHGGWWRALDKSDHSFIAPAFVRAGAAVVVPNYALCPTVRIDDIALQMVRALVWTWRNAARLNGDPRRIVVVGHSAGGHLATMLLCCDWRSQGADLQAQVVQAALSISGVVDLAPLAEAPFLRADLRLTAESVRRLSPVGFPAPAVGTLVCAVGGDESEEHQRQNGLMRDAWGDLVVTGVHTVEGANHFTVLHELVDAERPLHAVACSLLGLGGNAV